MLYNQKVLQYFLMDQLPVRNNTSFPKELAHVLENIKKDKDDPLRYHQRLVYEYLLKYPTRGILIYHMMGAGKTITGASLAEGLKTQDIKRKIIVMASKSLHANFRKDVIKYRQLMAEKGSEPNMSEEALNQYIDNTYQFISMNASNMRLKKTQIFPHLMTILLQRKKLKSSLS